MVPTLRSFMNFDLNQSNERLVGLASSAGETNRSLPR